ncbi:MAG: lysophospholipid acyltransferase family protein [Gammaproteobacteria bacterium]
MLENAVMMSRSAVVSFYGWLVALAGAVYFLVLGMLLSFMGLCLYPFQAKQIKQRVGRQGMHILSALFFAGLRLSGLVRFDLKGLDGLRGSGGIILVPNHPCLMDALFVASRLSNVVCVMKSSILYNPAFFGGASLGGFIRSDESPSRLVRHCAQSLQEGAQLLMFPEGTRTLDGSVNPFKAGFALVAQKTGAPVQTIIIEANSEFLGKRWPLWKKPDFPLIYKATLGDRFYVGKDQNYKLFAREVEAYFKNRLKEQSK